MTRYPAKIDDSQSLPIAIDNLTPVQGSIFNKLRDSVLAIESELGVKPASVYSSVRNRMDVLENIIGNLEIITLNKDLGGTISLPLVVGLQGNPISDITPELNQTIVWNGIAWIPTILDLNKILTNGNTSGINNLIIDNGQYVGFGSPDNLPITGNIRAETDLAINSNYTLSLNSGTITITGSSSSIQDDLNNNIITANNDGINLATSNTNRLSFDNSGAWIINSSIGTSGQYLRCGGSSTPTWSTILLSDLPTQATDTIVANVTAGTAVPTAVTLTSLAGSGLTVTAHQFAINNGSSLAISSSQLVRAALTGAITSSINSNTTAFKSFSAKSLLANATNASAIPTEFSNSAALQYLRSNAGNTALEYSQDLLIVTKSATPTVTAGHGAYWARNDAAASMPMFTNDVGNFVPLQNSCIVKDTDDALTNSTTIIDCTNTYTIEANTLRVGSKFRCSFTYRFTRGTTPTALNLENNFEIGSTTISATGASVTIISINAVIVTAEFTILSIGVSGDYMSYINAQGSGLAESVTTTDFSNTIDTTIDQDIRGTCRMTTAVLGCIIHLVSGHIEWIN